MPCYLYSLGSRKWQLSVSVFHSAEEEGPESDDEEEEDDNDVSTALAQLDIDKYLKARDRLSYYVHFEMITKESYRNVLIKNKSA